MTERTHQPVPVSRKRNWLRIIFYTIAGLVAVPATMLVLTYAAAQDNPNQRQRISNSVEHARGKAISERSASSRDTLARDTFGRSDFRLQQTVAARPTSSEMLRQDLMRMALNDPERERMIAALRSELTEEFQHMHDRQEKEIEASSKRLESLRSVHKQRGERKEEIINRRLAQLTGQPDVLDWNPQTGLGPSQSGFNRPIALNDKRLSRPALAPVRTFDQDQRTNPFSTTPPQLVQQPGYPVQDRYAGSFESESFESGSNQGITAVLEKTLKEEIKRARQIQADITHRLQESNKLNSRVATNPDQVTLDAELQQSNLVLQRLESTLKTLTEPAEVLPAGEVVEKQVVAPEDVTPADEAQERTAPFYTEADSEDSVDLPVTD